MFPDHVRRGAVTLKHLCKPLLQNTADIQPLLELANQLIKAHAYITNFLKTISMSVFKASIHCLTYFTSCAQRQYSEEGCTGLPRLSEAPMSRTLRIPLRGSGKRVGGVTAGRGRVYLWEDEKFCVWMVVTAA